MNTENSQHIWILIARKLSGEANIAEIQDLEQYLSNNPGVNYSNEILNDLWASRPETDHLYTEIKYKDLVLQIKNMGLDDGNFSENDNFLQPNPVQSHIRKYKKWLIGFASVAVISILFTITYFQYNQNGKPHLAELPSVSAVTTKNGSKTKLVLADGTKVWLNAGSEMTYDKNYGSKLREVTLTGEAYFDVVKNTEKPFIIHTAKMDIKVLGTSFNVKCYPGEKSIETSLIRGSIEVTLKDRKEKIMLKPNEKLVINLEDKEISKINIASHPALSQIKKPMIALGNLTILAKDSTVVETAWVQNRLVFISETFEDIALMMERWYGIKIIFTNETIKKVKFTGSFEKESIAEAFYAMQLITPFYYSIKGNVITISKLNHFKNK